MKEVDIALVSGDTTAAAVKFKKGTIYQLESSSQLNYQSLPLAKSDLALAL